MSITVYPVTPSFAAEIGDVDLSRPAGSRLAAAKRAVWEYASFAYFQLSLSSYGVGVPQRRDLSRIVADYRRAENTGESGRA